MNNYKISDSRYVTDKLVSLGFEPSLFIRRDGNLTVRFLIVLTLGVVFCYLRHPLVLFFGAHYE